VPFLPDAPGTDWYYSMRPATCRFREPLAPMIDALLALEEP
jgi:hypothetical protein